ncbi:nuclear transport factor 2 family protein [Streptomyces sp. AK02-01A]|uniref:nuclear transport factor 2 family protein n=1 Tax=Streptomyces sp. AK02-01A TaxID=3028648 RepID=UPI0029B78C5B|nr:nuclear transport factor 2 family protein [Streptomyces sp. AK02-01A]MDX3854658.1 nuclear transport factor 2 family protein [Streptomyces sp. AK02-01A]
MDSYDESYALGRAFHEALAAGDWDLIRSLLHDEAVWVLPGDNAVSGEARGADAVVERARTIAGYGLDFGLLHILVSRDNMALSLHNTARREDRVLDEYVITVCAVHEGKISDIETYLSDVAMMDAFFV